MIDATIVKGSPLGPGRRRGILCRAIGRSRTGITTKTPALTDALGNLVDFCLMPGQAHDLRETTGLPHDVSAGHLLADRALDAGWLRNDLPDRYMTPVIPPKSNRRFPAGFDNETCKRLSSRLPLPSFTQGEPQQTLEHFRFDLRHIPLRRRDRRIPVLRTVRGLRLHRSTDPRRFPKPTVSCGPWVVGTPVLSGSGPVNMAAGTATMHRAP